MNDKPCNEVWTPSGDRAKRVQEMTLTPQQFALISGANDAFSPAHAEQWMMFWKEDICEKDEFHTLFPLLSLAEARRVWLAMEEHLANIYYFLRVWPEWCSSGIWAPCILDRGGRVAWSITNTCRYPWNLSSGSGHGRPSTSPPVGTDELDWDRFSQTAEQLARDLKRSVGPRIYVEWDELVEVLMDGNTRSCRPVLGLPNSDRCPT